MPTEPHAPSAEEEAGDGVQGAGRATRSVATRSRPGARQAPAVHDPWALPRPGRPQSRRQPPPRGCRQNPILSLQDPQPPRPVQRPQSCTSRTGNHRRQKPIFENKIPASRSSSPGWKARGWKRTLPPSGQASRWNPRSRSRGPASPRRSGEDPAESRFSWSRRCRTLAPRPSDSFLSDAAWAGRGPPGGLRGRCASGAKHRAERTPRTSAIYTALERPPDLARKGAPGERLGGEGHGQGGRGRTGSLRASMSSA